MRRKDREMGKDFALSVIDKAPFGVLSMVDEKGEPHGLPLSIVRKGDYLYFHSAQEGQKVEIFKNSPRVQVTFVGNVDVPENFSEEELDEIIQDEKKTILLISSVFTTQYESAIVSGKIEEVNKKAEKSEVLKLICQKYTPNKGKYFPYALAAGLEKVNIYRIKIEEITGKRKKYDQEGKEMKWGRL